PEIFQTDIPAGSRKSIGLLYDIPALQYIAAINGAEATAIITDCTYSFRGCENALSATLISTTSGPDPYPERGEHVIRLALALGDSAPKSLYDTAFAFCHPVSVISGTNHSGALAPAGELISLNAASTILSSLGVTPDGAVLLRLYETAGKNDPVTVNMPFEIAQAYCTDLDGNCVTGKSVSINKNSLSFQMQPNTICGITVKAKE
ncbi:MAG: hypothetical protein FWF29_10475, partial [Treponema sp.]|nr:hypothetical protein [Treponema sp.]